MSGWASLANVAWALANLPGASSFRRALQDVRGAQTAILTCLLRDNADTEIGRRHRFDRITSPEMYRRQVPLSNYTDYENAIERIASGEEGVLTREPVLLLEPSGGSTGGAKWIPYTAGLQAQLRRAVAPWVFDLARRYPALLTGPAYWSVTPALRVAPGRRSQVPIGFEDDSAYLGGAFKWLVGATLAVPGHLARLQDLHQFRRLTALYLLRASDLRFMSVWHPTFLTLLWEFIVEHWESLLEDLRHGVHLPNSALLVRAHVSRARALSRLAIPSPQLVWPGLRIISCWGDGHSRLHLPELAACFSNCKIQPKGIVATEGFVSLPFEGKWPLAITSHFLEFIAPTNEPCFAWELEVGERYAVVLTTAGGLYRYRLHDVIEVVDRIQATPCVRFLHKEDHVSDLCGEKLTEEFANRVVQHTLRVGEIGARFALLAPSRVESPPRYVLFLETDPDKTLDTDAVSGALEQALRCNPHYAYCVGLGQLRPAVVTRVAAGAFERYAERLNREGCRLGDLKPTALSALSGWEVAMGAPRPVTGSSS